MSHFAYKEKLNIINSNFHDRIARLSVGGIDAAGPQAAEGEAAFGVLAQLTADLVKFSPFIWRGRNCIAKQITTRVSRL